MQRILLSIAAVALAVASESTVKIQLTQSDPNSLESHEVDLPDPCYEDFLRHSLNEKQLTMECETAENCKFTFVENKLVITHFGSGAAVLTLSGVGITEPYTSGDFAGFPKVCASCGTLQQPSVNDGNALVCPGDYSITYPGVGDGEFSMEIRSSAPFDDSVTSNASLNLQIAEGLCEASADVVFSMSKTTGGYEHTVQCHTLQVSLDRTALSGVTANDDMQDKSTDCNDVPAVSTSTLEDSCSEQVPLQYSTELAENMEGNYSFKRIFTTSHKCGSEWSHTQVITVTDNTPPTINFEGDEDASEDKTTSENCEDVDAISDAWDCENEVDYRDECQGGTSIHYEHTRDAGSTCIDSYTLTRSWTVMDAAGNSAVLSHTLNVTDNEAPKTTLTDSDFSTLSAECGQIPAPLSVTFNDNCDDNLEVEFAEDITGSLPNQSIIRTWTATDNCGNSLAKTRTVNVSDTVPPEITNSDNFASTQVNCEEGSKPCPVHVNDACDGQPELTVNSVKVSSDCDSKYVLVHTWTATDYAGNTRVETQTVSVNDTSPPVWSWPHADPAPSTTVTCDNVPSYGKPSVSGECRDFDVTGGCTQAAGGTDQDYQVNCSWSADDDCGTPATFTATIVVENVDSLFLPAPLGDISDLECGQSPSAPTLTARSPCCSSDITGVHSEVPVSSDDCGRTYINRWTFTDCASDVTETLDQTITVTDTTPPTLHSTSGLPYDTTVEYDCDSASTYPVAPTAVAKDACGMSSGLLEVPVTAQDSPLSTDTCSGSIERVWSASDDCGLTVEHVQTISSSDETPPTISRADPAVTGEECYNAGTMMTFTAEDCNNASVNQGTPESKDTTDDCLSVFEYSWTASDDCGNEETVTETTSVTVSGDATITSAASTLITQGYTLGNDGVWVKEVEDEADVILPTAASLSCDMDCLTCEFEKADDPKVSGCEESYSLTSTYTPRSSASDACSKTDSTNAITVRIEYKEPEASPLTPSDIPASTTEGCTDVAVPTVEYSQHPNPSVGIAAVTATLNPTDPTFACDKTSIRTWTHTDGCGRTASFSQTVTYLDNTPPEIQEAEFSSASPNVPTCDSYEPMKLTVKDECGPDYEVSGNAVEVSRDCTKGLDYKVTYSTQDTCGNSAEFETTVTLPLSAGEWDDAASFTAQDESCSVTAPTTNPTASDTCGSLDVSPPNIEKNPVGCSLTCANTDPTCYCSACTHTYTWSASDSCGSDPITHTATYTRQADDHSSISLTSTPASYDVTSECAFASFPTFSLELPCSRGTLSGADVSKSDVVVDTYGASVYTWTAAAAKTCSSVSLTETFTVSDDSPPEFLNSATYPDTTYECPATAPDSTYKLNVKDNCDGDWESSVGTKDPYSYTDDCLSQSWTHTFTETDTSGNSVSYVRTLVVTDESPPSITITSVSNDPVSVDYTADDTCGDVTVVCEPVIDESSRAACGFYDYSGDCTATDACGLSKNDSTTPETHTPTVLFTFSTYEETTTATCLDDWSPPTVTCTVTIDGETVEASLAASVAFTPPAGDCDDGTHLATFTCEYFDATTLCGTDTAQQTIVVEDDTPPGLSGLQSTTGDCSEIATLEAALTSTHDSNVSTASTQSCGCIDTANTSSGGVGGYTCDHTDTHGCYSYTEEWKETITDCCGNVNTDTVKITIYDGSPPGLDATQSCTDLCDTDPTKDSDNYKKDVVCPDTYTSVDWVSCTDSAGNVFKQETPTKYSDTTPPTLIGLDSPIADDTTYPYTQIPAKPTGVTFSDNDDQGNATSPTDTTVKFTQRKVATGTNDHEYLIIRTWKAEDNCGNTREKVQTIEVEDVDMDHPADANKNCDEIADYATPYFTADDLTLGDNAGDFHSVTVSPSKVSEDCDDQFVEVYTFTVTHLHSVDEEAHDDSSDHTETFQSTLTVVDNAPPVISPASYTSTTPEALDADCAHSAIPTYTSATDNCTPTVSVTEVNSGSPSADERVTGVHWVWATYQATDACGLTDEKTYSVSVEDSTPPTVDVDPTDETCDDQCTECTAPEPTGADNCDTDVAVTTAKVVKSWGSDACWTGTATYTYKLTDDNGNFRLHDEQVVYQDNSPPTFNPYDYWAGEVPCDDPPPSSPTFTECGVDNNAVLTPGTTYPTATYTITDACGNVNSQTQAITLVDSVPPQWTAAGFPNFTATCAYECGQDEATACPEPTTQDLNDNCDGTVQAPAIGYEEAYTGSCGWSKTVRFQACDSAGNCSEEKTQVISYDDSTPPNIFTGNSELKNVSCAADLTGAVGQVEKIAKDQCDTALEDATIVEVDDTNQTDCGNGSVKYTFRATDACGNVKESDHTVDILSTSKGNWPGAAELQTVASVDCIADLEECPTLTYTYDSCLSKVTLSCNDDPHAALSGAPVCANNVSVVRKFTGSGECGEVLSKSVTFTSRDDSPPVITTKYNGSETGGHTADCTEDINSLLSNIEATTSDTCDGDGTADCDNCSGTSPPTPLSVTMTDDTYVYEFSASDECANLAAPATFTFVVEDNTPPVFDDSGTFQSSQDFVVCEQYYGENKSLSGIKDSLTAMVDAARTRLANDWNDACELDWDPATSTTDISAEAYDPDEELCGSGNKVLSVKYEATDSSGNVATAEYQLTVYFMEAPTWDSEPSSDPVNEECGYTNSPNDASVVRTCAQTSYDNEDVTVTGALTNLGDSCVEKYVNSWFYSHDCGNLSVQQTVTVSDSTPPDIVVAESTTIECSSSSVGSESTYVANAKAVSPTDSCENLVIGSYVDTDPFGDVCFRGKVFTFSAQDSCGNSVEIVRTFAVEDTTPPSLTPANPPSDPVTYECADGPARSLPQVTADDTCAMAAYSSTVTPQEDPVTTDLYVYTATDDCGLKRSYSVQMEARDTSPPSIPSSFSVTESSECITSAPEAPVVNFEEDCGDASTSKQTLDLETNSCTHLKNYIFEYTATNDAGLITVAHTTVTVHDDAPPVIDENGHPESTTHECDGADPSHKTDLTASDCDTSVATPGHERTGAGTPGTEYTLVDTYTATDGCGLTDVFVMRTEIVDSTPPNLSNVPDDTEVEIPNKWDGDVSAVTSDDDCDPNLSVVFDSTQEPGDCPQSYEQIYTWTSEDSTGNLREESTTITYTDLTPPSISLNYQEHTVNYLDNPIFLDGATAAATVLTAAGFTYSGLDGNTNVPVTVSVTSGVLDENVADQGQNEGVWAFAFYAEDDCGNSVEEVATLTVEDTLGCVFDKLPEGEDVTAECDAIPEACVISCTDDSEPGASVQYSQDDSDASKYIRSWSFTDDARNPNTSTFEQTIHITDTSPPLLSASPEPSVTVECDCDKFPTIANIKALDNCDGVRTVSDSDDKVITGLAETEVYKMVRSWSASDTSGNSVRAEQTVVVQDTQDPVFYYTPPAPDADTCFSEENFPQALALDSCDEDMSVAGSTPSPDGSFACNTSGAEPKQVTYTATDEAGNTSSTIVRACVCSA